MRSRPGFHWFLIVAAAVLLLAVCNRGHAQTTLVVSYEAQDASQFGYKSGAQGVAASLTHRFNQRWEGVIAGDLSAARKSFLSDGHHLSGGLAARFYLTDNFFVVAGASISADRNSQYSKTVARPSIGAGLKVGGFIGTLTAFAPVDGLLPDPNSVRGATLTVEYFKPLFGPVGLYTAGQTSVASFTATYDPSQGFTGVVYKARAGVYFSF